MPWWVLRATDPRDLVMTENWRRCAALIAALTASFALSVPAQAASIASEPPGALLPLPSLPVNACHNSSLPQDYGTNFPVPNDPNGFGFANQTVIGWEGNYYAPFAYLSGSYFARGVPDTYTQGDQSYCGAMYHGGRVPAGADHFVRARQREGLDHRLRRQADHRREPGRARLHQGLRDQPGRRVGERAVRPVRAGPGRTGQQRGHGRARRHRAP